MTYNTGIVIIILACLAAGVSLVITEHYGWAWIPFLVLFGIHSNKDKP